MMVDWLFCPVCGKRFLRQKKNQKYCSDECRREQKNKGRRKPKEIGGGLTWPQIVGICEEHGVSYGQAVAKGLLK